MRHVQSMWVVAVSLYAVAAASGQVLDTALSPEGPNWQGAGAWTVAEGPDGLTGTFEPIGMPFPHAGRWVASNGAFAGDYSERGVAALRFDFRAVDGAPSALVVRWHGGGQVYSRSLSAAVQQAAPGEWVRFELPLDPESAGEWRGNPDAFSAALRDVQSVVFEVTRSGADLQRFELGSVALATETSRAVANRNIITPTAVLARLNLEGGN